jgi:hypothetical protein
MTPLKTLLLALGALCLAPLAGHAEDISLLFSYQDPNGTVSGDFNLTATAIANDPGAYLATGGSLNLIAPAADGIAGNYTIIPSYSAPNTQYSPTGMFIYDNLVMPGASPVVTNPGLLAFGGPATGLTPEGRGAELNLFSVGDNTYDLYTASNGTYTYSHEFSTPQGSISAQVVTTPPIAAHSQLAGRNLVVAAEPSTWAIMAGFLLIILCIGNSRQAIRE